MDTKRNALADYYTTADVLNTPIRRGGILPLTEYATRAEFDSGSGLLGSIANALTAPGRAWRGEIQQGQEVPEAVNLAGLLTLGGFLSPKPSNALGMGGAAAKRARALGYDDTPFYRGEATGQQPSSYDAGAFFSRDQEYARGFANRGGADEPREFRLNLGNSYRDYEPVTASVYNRLLESMPETQRASFVDLVAPGKDAAWFSGFAHHRPDYVVAESGALLRQAIETQLASPETVFKRANFDAIDSGRDVRKLTGDGIRHVDAKFDPAKASSRNIFYSSGLFPPIYPTED